MGQSVALRLFAHQFCYRTSFAHLGAVIDCHNRVRLIRCHSYKLQDFVQLICLPLYASKFKIHSFGDRYFRLSLGVINLSHLLMLSFEA